MRLFALLMLISIVSSAQSPIRLSDDIQSLRFSVIQYFPFIEATINGVKGKLMFDTGNEQALSINEHLVTLKSGKTIGRGFVGSGQSFDVHLYDTISEVTLDNKMSIVNAGPALGNDARFMENITPDILGMIGYQFFKGYLFKLDYESGLITFYRNTIDRQQKKDFLKDETVIGVLNFKLRKLPNHPVIRIVSSSDTLAISFDTGQFGGICLTDELRSKWMNNGNLSMSDQKNLCELKLLELPGGIRTTPGMIPILTGPSGANQPIGITESNVITLGYGFLKQYKTVWDFDNRKIYLLHL